MQQSSASASGLSRIGRWDNCAITAEGRVHTKRFDLSRDGNRVTLDVAADYATCEDILRVYHGADAWREYNEALNSFAEQ